MSIRGDMEYGARDKTGLSLDTCRDVISAALEAAHDPNFAIRYQREMESETALGDYFAVIEFLKKLVQ